MRDADPQAMLPIVLVVEDECILRMQAVEAIEDAGFGVLEASNADEAISLLETRKDIEVVFTDIEMPGSMDGLRLARAIRDRWPPVEVILTSGRRRPDPNEIPARGRFVPKPYSPDVLIETIREAATGI